jgi:hypothetical protein
MPTPMGVEMEARYGTSQPGAAKRREPDFGFVLGREISDQKMLRVVTGNREELGGTHHDWSLIAFNGMSRAKNRRRL